MTALNHVFYFYLGTFLTWFGSLLFVMSIPSFLPKSDCRPRSWESRLAYTDSLALHTVTIQTETPKERIGAVMAARGLTVAIVLSIGELFGGHIQKVLPLSSELTIRASICLFVIFLVALVSRSKRSVQ